VVLNATVYSWLSENCLLQGEPAGDAMEDLPYFHHGAMNRCPTFRGSGRFLSEESKQEEQGNKLYSACSENRDE
jgi:hypothetical protein